MSGPHVVIVGGYLTMPAFYRPMRRRLLDRGAAHVSIARLYLPDWLALGMVGFGPVMLRGARAIREARRTSDAPLIVVGHSAGGIVSRLAMSPEPFDGRQVDVADDVGCLVTLGTPHTLYDTIPGWQHPALKATRFLERVTPGAWFAPTTGYVTVGSSRVLPGGDARTHPFKRPLNSIMGAIVGQTPGVRGDGMVGNDLSQLAGARHIELPDVLHGTFGGPWYGDGHVIDRWWPVALESWREARAARAREAGWLAESMEPAHQMDLPGRDR
jgi:hypothetical protein